MVNFNASSFAITATLVAVTDTDLWLSAEATGGGATDSLIFPFSHGSREATIKALRDGARVEIGGPITLHCRRSGFNWTLGCNVMPNPR